MRILYIDDLDPHFSYGFGYGRSYLIICELRRAGATVDVFSGMPRWWALMVRDPTQVPAEWLEPDGRVHAFVSLLTSNKYDFVWISRPKNFLTFGRAAARQIGASRVIYDCEALTSVREFMRAKVRGGCIKERVGEESAVLLEAGNVVCASNQEAALLRGVGVRVVGVVSYYPLPQAARGATTTAQNELSTRRNGCIFGGSFVGASLTGVRRDLATPNEDAVEILAGQLGEELQSITGSPVEVCGHGCSTIAGRYAASHWLRFSEGQASYFDIVRGAKIFVAPTRYASGIPCKVIDAVGAGRLVVMSTLLRNNLGMPHLQFAAARSRQEMSDYVNKLNSGSGADVLRDQLYEWIYANFSIRSFRAACRDTLRKAGLGSPQAVRRSEDALGDRLVHYAERRSQEVEGWLEG